MNHTKARAANALQACFFRFSLCEEAGALPSLASQLGLKMQLNIWLLKKPYKIIPTRARDVGSLPLGGLEALPETCYTAHLEFLFFGL
jgi:hypothetical protein